MDGRLEILAKLSTATIRDWLSIRLWPKQTCMARWSKVSRSQRIRFRGTGNFRYQHYSVGYLSYRLPTIMDVPATDAGFHR